ncbi:diguanylate cyclase (GGDEF) domain-containing protein [Duganella sp. CF458]|uniref:putative bifunctional diguanylate cyclase/phosphodiesterase n=1 Tax=Duganella sp. CF458 TaxID=1884368 RepID=UPI0008E982DD|nr:bifunctional diguanylate cyclase/phosphodiesterase [Duganella sp. CF458]SFG18464.1 diguanylate cyclase (GGDEF) domain-containing protein [Duganella sp. CF458]
MDTPIASLYLISAGALAMSAFQSALVARNSSYVRACWAFAVICLTFACFQYANVRQQLAPGLAEAITAHKWVNFFSLLLAPQFCYLVASLDPSRAAFRLSYGIAFISAVLAVDNFMVPYGYRFSSLASDAPTELAWGEHAFLLFGETTAAYSVSRLLSLGAAVFAVFYFVRMQRQRARFSNRLVWSSAALVVVTTALGGATDTGMMPIPYLSGFGFLFLAASYLLLVKREATQRLTENIRISAALERELASHKLSSRRIERALTNDELTRLPNREGALEKLRTMSAWSESSMTRMAVLLLDLDRLAIINGTRGYEAGNQVLIEVAQRLREHCGKRRLVARLGSARFVVAIAGHKTLGGIEREVEGVLAAIKPPFAVAGNILNMTFSAGVAIYPDHAESAEDLLASAGLALHEARDAGPGSMRTFHPSLQQSLSERIGLENELKDALENGELFLHYQPQVCAVTERVLGMEALIRWQHPELGLVMPDKFIPLAESTGTIASIGAWVIESACRQLQDWRALGFSEVRMAVNLSAQQLLLDDLDDSVKSALRRAGLMGADLELEITESVLMQDPQRSIERLETLRGLGVRLSIDDFGTGYSSLGYLKMLPVHSFKLDRSFVRDIGTSEKDLEICATAVGLARKLGLEIVAEGVEDTVQAMQLRHLGCNLLQGYYFARPLAAHAATNFLMEQREAAA